MQAILTDKRTATPLKPYGLSICIVFVTNAARATEFQAKDPQAT